MDLPIWGRGDAFSQAPEGWGWLDEKNRRHSCASAAELISIVRDDLHGRVMLVWFPSREHMALPEELVGAEEAILTSRKRLAADDLLVSFDRLRWYSGLLGLVSIYMFYQGWAYAPQVAAPAERLFFGVRAVLSSMSVGVCFLMFLILAFIPWYQARKRLRELDHWNGEDLQALIPVLRFETWMDLQKSPATRFLLALTALVGLAQLLPTDGIAAAGLDKELYLRQGEWWRLFTAPFLHGNPIHFLMNASALLYLGKRLEVFARWPHLPLVFLLAACVGGEASARFLTTTSVGASGGLMGWLGFLLVFETLHQRLVPRTATRRLLAGVLLTGLIGLIGYRFIDNAAHAGGLAAGMLYAIIVFPKSASANRPNATLTDRIAGAAALVVLTLSAALAFVKITGLF